MYYFELFSHKGDIKILNQQDYKGEMVRSEVQEKDFNYQLRQGAISDYDKIVEASWQPDKYLILDTRPWPMRKLMGELNLPNV